MEVPTSRQSRRLNVLGLLKRHNDLVPDMVAGKGDTAVIVACFEQFSQHIAKKTSVLLAHGPLHRSQEFIEQIPKWVKHGLSITYLPPYSPELNRIEILWRFMQYYWLPFSAYTSFQHLVAAIEELLTRFGAQYTITFQAA